MKTKITSICLLFLVFSGLNTTKGQGKSGISLGAQVAMPLSDNGGKNKLGGGVGLEYSHGLKSIPMDITFAYNYTRFYSGMNTAELNPLTILADKYDNTSNLHSLRIGVNVYPLKGSNFYLGADLGGGTLQSTTGFYTVSGSEVSTSSAKVSYFTIAPRVGYLIPVGKGYVDLSLRYENNSAFKLNLFDSESGVSTFDFLSLRAAYRFDLSGCCKKAK